MTAAPAGIDQFPLTPVDSDCIPGVTRIERWNGGSRRELFVTVAFTMASYHNGF
jgi:hypothetical protein